MMRLVNKSAERTKENSPTIYRWEKSATKQIQSATRTAEIRAGSFSTGVFSRPLHGLLAKYASCNPALKCWATIIRPLRGLFRLLPAQLLPTAFFLLLTASCSLLTVHAQPGMPQPNSPLYGARPETGRVSTGLPPALQKVGIDQRLNEQVPLDAAFKDECGNTVQLGQYFGKRPVV